MSWLRLLGIWSGLTGWPCSPWTQPKRKHPVGPQVQLMHMVCSHEVLTGSLGCLYIMVVT